MTARTSDPLLVEWKALLQAEDLGPSESINTAIRKKRQQSFQLLEKYNKEVDGYLNLEVPSEMQVNPYLSRAIDRNHRQASSLNHSPTNREIVGSQGVFLKEHSRRFVENLMQTKLRLLVGEADTAVNIRHQQRQEKQQKIIEACRANLQQKVEQFMESQGQQQYCLKSSSALPLLARQPTIKKRLSVFQKDLKASKDLDKTLSSNYTSRSSFRFPSN